MFYPCPHCQFLVAHHPQLRSLPASCPRCGLPLQEESAAPAGDAGAAPETGPDAALAAFTDDAGDPTDGGQEERDHHAAGSFADATSSTAPAATPTNAPSAFAIAAPRDRRAHWSWPLIALLAMLLVLQVLLADRARLAADPRWRPLLEPLCAALRCDLPAWHEPAAFAMLDRKVRPAPQPGALRVDATFRNEARWAQDWPALQLALSDADGRVLGSRVFQPGEYLGAEPATRLSPGQSAQITFLVQEPAPGTVAFSFEFR